MNRAESIPIMYEYLKIAPGMIPILKERVGERYHSLYRFLYSSFASGVSPFALLNMQKTISHLLEGIATQSAFYILGDKDADGVSAMSILKNYLEELGCPVYYNMPLNDETYGSSERILKDIEEKKHLLHSVITVDTGIQERELSLRLKEWGLSFVVTDHHTPSLELPETPFLINPHLHKENFLPFCGAGLALKLVQGLFLAQSSYYESYKQALVVHYDPKSDTLSYTPVLSHIFLPFSEQYTLKEKGEKHYQTHLNDAKTLILSEKSHQYLQAHYKTSMDHKVLLIAEQLKGSSSKFSKKPKTFSRSYPTYSLLSFVQEWIQTHLLNIEKHLSVAIQSAGIATLCDRMPLNHAENRGLIRTAFTLFVQDKNHPLYSTLSAPPKNFESFTLHTVPMQLGPLLNAGGRLGKADMILDFLCSKDILQSKKNLLLLNRERRKKQLIGLQEVEAFLKLEEAQNSRPYIFYASENIHKGVTGIIANKLSKQYSKPALILSVDNNLERIVGSARSPFPIYSVLNQCNQLFSSFGGHPQACGFSLTKGEISQLEDHLSKIDWENLEKPLHSKYPVIYPLEVEWLQKDFFHSLDLLAPYGEANMPPLFQITRKFENAIVFGKQNIHLKWSYPGQQGSEFIFWQALSQHPLEHYLSFSEPTMIFSVIPDDYYSEKYNLVVQDMFDLGSEPQLEKHLSTLH